MPFHVGKESSRSGTRRGHTRSTDNLEPLTEQSDDEDEIEIVENPNYGLSVKTLSLRYEPRVSSSPTTPYLREIRIIALDTPSHPHSEDISAVKKGIDVSPVAVHRVEQGKWCHESYKHHVAPALTKEQRNQATSLPKSNVVVSPVSKTTFTDTSTRKLFYICLTFVHGSGLLLGRNIALS
jgi:hypothetical protein